MLVNSLQFIIFIFFMISIYFILPYKFRNLYLAVCSYWFYCSYIPEYIALLLISTFISYGIAILIESADINYKRKILLISSLAIFIFILFLFKYYNFFSNIINYICSLTNVEFRSASSALIVPVGISFYTFTIISYLSDVYTGKIRAEKNFIDYSLYISFFAKMVCGPIERAEDLLPQLKRKYDFNYERVVSGGKRIIWGLFKKIAIADMLAVYINAVWKDIYNYKGLTLLITMLLYSIQIYCDFSGYSDIAIGISKGIGFELKENFQLPYMAESLKEFWNRWHISLNSWLKEYIYYPLGGGRKGAVHKKFNIMAVFLVSGLWHGADMTFILWGGGHGLLRILEEYASKITSAKISVIKYIKRGYTFLIITLVWVLFRADTVQSAFYMYSNFFREISFSKFIIETRHLIYETVFESNSFFAVYIVWVLLAIVYMTLCESMRQRLKNIEYIAIILISLFWYVFQNGIWGQTGNFIYINF